MAVWKYIEKIFSAEDTPQNPRDIIFIILGIAFVVLVIIYPPTKNQPASILQAVNQVPSESWELVQSVPDDIYSYYPLAIGNSWEYKGQEKLWSDYELDGKEIIKPYDHTITIKTIKKNKNNVFEIEKETCNGKDNQNNPGSCNPSKFYLVNNNICYSRDCYGLELSFPLPEDQVLLDQSYKERIGMGIDDKMYVNYIHKKQSSLVLGKEMVDCFPIEYVTLPDESIDIFCYGIGFVSFRYKHHGFTDDIEDKLVKINFVK